MAETPQDPTPEPSDKVWSDTLRHEPTREELAAAGVDVPDALKPVPPRPDRARGQRAARANRMPLMLTLALGFAGLVLAWIVGVTFVQWRAQVAEQEKLRAAQEAQRQSQLQVEQMQREALARQAQLQAEQQRQEELRVQAFENERKAHEAARRAEADAVERKEKAWARYYRPPAHCVSAATMECTNRYIRAKREFEELYAKGAL